MHYAKQAQYQHSKHQGTQVMSHSPIPCFVASKQNTRYLLQCNQVYFTDSISLLQHEVQLARQFLYEIRL